MRAGDILLFKGESGISKLIAWGTKSEYTHVAVCVAPGMHLAVEAISGGGVRARDIRRIADAYDIYRIKTPYAYDLDGVISHMIDKLNKRYDYLGVVFLGIMKLLAIAGIPIKDAANAWQKDRDYFCSELCYEAFYGGGGLDIVPQIDAADITSPGDIARSEVLERVRNSKFEVRNS